MPDQPAYRLRPWIEWLLCGTDVTASQRLRSAVCTLTYPHASHPVSGDFAHSQGPGHCPGVAHGAQDRSCAASICIGDCRCLEES